MDWLLGKEEEIQKSFNSACFLSQFIDKKIFDWTGEMCRSAQKPWLKQRSGSSVALSGHYHSLSLWLITKLNKNLTETQHALNFRWKHKQ